MRLDNLWIGDFKNLRDFTIDFDEDQTTTVLIGHNATGKSNLIEALVIIFRNLDLKKKPEFSYDLTYFCRDHKIQINADRDKKAYSIFVDGQKTSFSTFSGTDRKYLPKYIFAYYSGPSGRLEYLFDAHQRKFYDELLKGNIQPLRPFFYARPIHSQFVLLSFFSFEDKESRKFLEDYLDVSGLESVDFILKQPSWTSRQGDERFWNARGVVQKFLSNLWDYSLAPTRESVRIQIGFRKSATQTRLHLFLPNETKLKELARNYENNRNFFKMLESTYISELIREVRIKIKKKNVDKSITFAELAEGEQQLLTVLGLLKFTKDEESLFLLDEPDTHLNPVWSFNYFGILDKVVGPLEKSQIIICTHDPLVIGGLLKTQVQIFEKDEETGKISAKLPDQDPRGMGVAALLTSELFGLSTTLDSETQSKLDRKRELYIKDQEGKLTLKERMELQNLFDELGSLDFTKTTRDPLYEKFVRAVMSREEFKKTMLSNEDRQKQEKIAKKIIDKILAEEKQ